MSVTPSASCDGAVELRLLYPELVKDVVFLFSGQIRRLHFLHKHLCLFHSSSEHRDEVFRMGWGKRAGRLGYGCGQLVQAGDEEFVLAVSK